jgi:hypothetical protein
MFLFHQVVVFCLFIFDVNVLEFLKSFFLVSLTILSITSSKYYKLKWAKRDTLKVVFTIIALVVVSFEIIQILEFYFYGSSKSWFFLDGYSISTAKDVGRFEAVNFLSYMRPISFYHEPSYLGLVLFCIFLWGMVLRFNLFVMFVLFCGIILSFSTTILIFLSLYLIINIFINSNKFKILMYLTMITIVIFLFSSDLLLLFRLGEIANNGSSGYSRLLLPLNVVYNSLFNNRCILGIPFGNLPVILDNSFFLIVCYFGLLFPFFFFLMFGSVKSQIMDNSSKLIYSFVVVSCLFVNGAFFTPEVAVLIIFSNYILIDSGKAKSVV